MLMLPLNWLVPLLDMVKFAGPNGPYSPAA
jgi:hypothetical protein